MPAKKPAKKVDAVKGVADHVTKQGDRNNTLAKGERRVGCSKGVTLNLGNFQSARIDFWMEKVVDDNDRDALLAYNEMAETLEDLIKAEQDELESED